ncbi:MAG: class I SAM-dependent methyltransferase [Acidimicrobiia bacterium]
MRTDLGDLTDVEAVSKIVDVDGLDLLDVGCGSGTVARLIADKGAVVRGIEPDPVQAEQNRAADLVENVTLDEGRAEAVAAADDSYDGVMFLRSLHHVPRESMDQALQEAARVLRPDGFLLVVEPGMACSHFEMMQPFHDEGEVRTLAQEALARTADGLFADREEYLCMQHPRYESFDALVDRMTGMSFNDITREMIDVPEVRARFEAERSDDGYVFEQPILINLYRSLRPG